ncbi:hypothetical protein R1sor_016465 [Riccia sorocarpa]|uniref:Aldehyde dehydrogenase domain-containing protein n=1 Tax=Riccia sorocarpa TaxID=122646 RepID=A0ABD3HH37_9MARC
MAVAKVPSRKLFIGGEWVTPARGGKIPIICPTTEEQIGQIPAATAEDVDAAVKAARQAFTRNNGKDWSRASGKHRAKILRAIAAKVVERKKELAVFVSGSLAAGCTAVLKPSKVASVTCLELGKIAQDVGLHPGVLNIITGLGPEAGAPLSYHPDVDKVSFTGSYNTGRTIMKVAAETVKPVTVELGGKSPLVIFDDVDLDKAVEWAMFGALWTNGQICSATSSVLLQEGIAPAFLKKLAAWTSSIKISNPLEKDCRLCPLVNDTQYQKVKDFVKEAQDEGATLLCGGKRPPHLEKGYFLEPTVLTDVTPSMRIWKEEVFGPVLTVTLFKTEEEAITLANDTQYGLGGAVISKDEGRCKRVAELLDAGIVWINCSQPCFCQAPWGGKNRSGFGRELGEWGLENYLSVKQITRYVSDDPFGWYPASKL